MRTAIMITCAALMLSPAREVVARSKKEQIAELKQEADKLQSKIDKALMAMFRDQVQAAVYRSRLSILQKEWQKLFTAIGGRPKLPTPTPPPPKEFRVKEVTGSDAEGLAQAVATGSCKKKKGCRVWARIVFGKTLVKDGSKFEVSADIKNKSGKRYAIPSKELSVSQPIMVVDLPLEGLYLRKGHYDGTIRILCDGRYKSKSFTFQLINTY